MSKEKERLIDLRAQLRQAAEFENHHETWSDIMTKLLNTAHNISIKAEHEVQRLQSMLDKSKGTKETADMLADIIINTIHAFNNQEVAKKSAMELKKNGEADVPSPGDLEVQQREKEAEEIAKKEERKTTLIKTDLSKTEKPIKNVKTKTIEPKKQNAVRRKRRRSNKK